MQAISVKELRENLPAIRGELKKGESFLIIHKSKPIAKLEPFETLQQLTEEDKNFEEAAVADVNAALGDDYLTKEEAEYYLSLPNKK